ncbi:M60 family metallopeptidase [Spiroplasma platyhelix]|uniref:Peptidase M60 domain-containing protein n=1 Tax=Spiroplasma platyhelix PALS-1 TaxID=1276218 RepID=A0A846UCT7_9MOLU|nr:M60 family metallopeptidase [Spiroplasma platyhelix]MBE4703955.1 hypothetical protein [Spiroplasma platyhelix PALS-1]NKE38328.1 hypothetical protein [Spiroplasma platyhelix PALS-1]UJB29213.1 hypothetical protein SPLAT_v1c04490 [Spiroplasma platyhelix PALS-1]
MKFNFRQSLLLLTSTFGVLTVANSVSIININRDITSTSGTTLIKDIGKISKTVVAEAQGDVNFNKVTSNLGYKHSEFSPTGIFVTKDSVIDIYCPEVNNVYAVVGQWGKYKDLNEGRELRPEKIALAPGNLTVFQPKQDGMLYISNQSTDIDIKVMINVINGITVPTFTLDETTSEEFNQLINTTTSPFVELVGKNFFGTFQIALANELWKNNLAAINKLNDIIKNWDEVYELSNYVSGLSLDFDGVAKKHHNLIHITNPDTGGGSASAGDYFLRFHQGGDIKGLFKNKNSQWGLWHETGHTYQNPNYTFDGFGEVSVNINSFWIQEEQGFRNRMFTDKNAIAAIKNHINSTNPNKGIKDLNVWGRLGVFLQLHMAYGKEFFPRLNQEYRLLTQSEKPKSDAEKYQSFIKVTSKTVNRNLIPFFEKWGIHANAETIKAVQSYPLLKTEIWNNIFDGNIEDKAIIDYKLEKYNPLTGVKIKQDKILNLNVGDKVDQTAVKNALENVSSDMEFSEIAEPDWNAVNWNNKENINYSSVSLSQPNKSGNKYLVPTKVTANNSIRVFGLGDIYQGIFGLNTTEKKFFISPKTSRMHSYFKGKPYVSVSISDENGNVIYDVTANGDDSTMKFNGLNNISFKNNYKIKFWFAEANRGMYYEQGRWNKVRNNGNSEITFEIIDNSWVRENWV